MNTIRLGGEGRPLQPMGVGAWAWGDRLFWDYGRGYGKEDLRAAFEASVEAGVELFDTAELYGFWASEKLLGEFARGSKKPIRIASKCFPYPWRVSARFLNLALRGSLRRLQRDQVDLYQMHWPYAPVSVESWMHRMADAVEEGLIQQIGVSNYSPAQTERAHRVLERRGHRLASNQIPYSLLDRQVERSGLLDLCADLGVSVIAYSPLGQGLLTGKYTADRQPPGVRGMRFTKVQLRRAERVVQEMRAVGKKHGGKSPAQVAINWAIQKGSIPIPGAKNRQQAEENAGALGWDLSVEDVERLDEVSD